MKELSIEEKAKAYDEALKEAVIAHKDEDKHLKATLERIFPELKESEDEKILRQLRNFFKNHINSVYEEIDNNNDVLAWLKKQEEQAKFRDSIQVGDKVTRNEDGVLVNLSQLKRIAKPAEEYNITGIGSKNPTGKLGEMIKKKLEMEKQGEHKPADKYTFKAIPCLLGMIQPTDRAKSYCQKLIDNLEQEGYSIDAKIVRDCLKQMNGEKVAMATMDEQKPTWSEEDKLKSSILIHVVKKQQGSAIFEGLLPEELIEWLEKKGEQNPTWKPSVEQMIILRQVINGCSYDIEPLVEMEEQLKKLM